LRDKPEVDQFASPTILEAIQDVEEHEIAPLSLINPWNSTLLVGIPGPAPSFGIPESSFLFHIVNLHFWPVNYNIPEGAKSKQSPQKDDTNYVEQVLAVYMGGIFVYNDVTVS
jgi:hypothetical protein